MDTSTQTISSHTLTYWNHFLHSSISHTSTTTVSHLFIYNFIPLKWSCSRRYKYVEDVVVTSNWPGRPGLRIDVLHHQGTTPGSWPGCRLPCTVSICCCEVYPLNVLNNWRKFLGTRSWRNVLLRVSGAIGA